MYNDMENICFLNVHKFKISTTTITIDKVESKLTTNKKKNKKKTKRQSGIHRSFTTCSSVSA